MATLEDRPFSKDYSGLVNQTVVAGVVLVLGTSAFEIMKRARRLKKHKRAEDGAGSVETWEFGYLFNGRTWAENPSPLSASKWPVISWAWQAITFKEEDFFNLRGLDATLYVRLLMGCVFFCVAQLVTIFPILLPIHIVFSQPDVARKSLLRASISSLTGTSGQKFFPIHVVSLYWIVISWTITLVWCAKGLFQYRSKSILAQKITGYDKDKLKQRELSTNRGLRWRTVMVTNVPHALRDEAALREYFTYYMSRPMHAPMAQSFLGKLASFLFRRARRTAANILPSQSQEGREQLNDVDPPLIERVYIVRKLTDLASYLDKREDTLRKLELAHIKLARTILQDVKRKMDHHPTVSLLGAIRSWWKGSSPKSTMSAAFPLTPLSDEDQLLIKTLGPFVQEFDVQCPDGIHHLICKLRHGQHKRGNQCSDTESGSACTPGATSAPEHANIWEALHSLPREILHRYQPLIRLNKLFYGQTAPSIDLYSVKLTYITGLLEEQRATLLKHMSPASTAFVTFESPVDAMRACKYLPSHPENPLSCVTSPAPEMKDLDWDQVMKSAFTGTIIKDWVISLGVWTFTCLWIIPVSLFVSLVSIQNIASFIPPLERYLAKHPFVENVISNFLPTFLVSILAILIPIFLWLIAKKAHLTLTFSDRHDIIMIRYHKFLVCNLLVFFCVGVAALESILTAFRTTIKVDVVELVAVSYPTAGPFYVGDFHNRYPCGIRVAPVWCMFSAALLFDALINQTQLPLLVYPSTRSTPLPRKRALGIRPRTLNYYYWLPNHVFVMFILLVFSVINPLVIPFALIYFAVQYVVIKNQMLHVYAKPYELNGRNILIRFTRYSMDGLVLAEVVLIAFLFLNRWIAPGVFVILLIPITIAIKLYLTRVFDRKFDEADVLEAEVACGLIEETAEEREASRLHASRIESLPRIFSSETAKFWTWGFPLSRRFTYSLHTKRKPAKQQSRPETPFRHPREPAVADEKGGESPIIHQEQAPSPPKTPGPRRGEEVNDMAARHQGTMEGADFTGAAGPSAFAAPTVSAFEAIRDNKPVTDHAPHPRWDDSAGYDLTYDNPYYARYVENFLWLPKDPFGKVDLDDTVDMHRSLTATHLTRRIGEWLNAGASTDPQVDPSGLKPYHAVIKDVLEEPLPNGDETIVLPEAIASRVGVDPDIEDPDRPRLWRRASSASSMKSKIRTRKRAGSAYSMVQPGGTARVSVRVPPVPRPSVFDHLVASPAPEMGGTSPTRSTPQSPSFPFHRAESLELEGTEYPLPDLSRGPSSKISAHSLPSDSGPSTARQRSRSVTATEALVGEVVVEEQEEAEDRERLRQQEQEEQEQNERARRSWLWRWLYKHAYLQTPPPPPDGPGPSQT